MTGHAVRLASQDRIPPFGMVHVRELDVAPHCDARVIKASASTVAPAARSA